MDESHDRGALSDRGRTALGRPRAYVAGRIDARHTGLEQALRPCVWSGQDESIGISRVHVAEPIGAGSGAEEEEEIREGQRRPIGERHRLKPPFLPVQGAHCADED